MHVVVTRNAKQGGDVEKTRDDLFLFNYFVADDANVTLGLWDYLAGRYETETGLDNSTLLVPLEGEACRHNHGGMVFSSAKPLLPSDHLPSQKLG